ncbi:anti-sigma factor [Haloechinothrix sp. LS1_15]|uniref:anti-sigma factor n=1 Tax=Haloechinothrix sp. LS1_15 TaxID=2652248 RepID=UPI0029461D21|nr:anti-sigma factor [Haloechinothrix sp. LS1_15]MDV6011399.1 anti-sigma factor [Haloechinothrix sp. LS1_15]
MNADIHMLTGAYVLNALSEDEREAFEAHLARCTACAREVHELRETTARLGFAAAESPPASLRSRVLAGVRNTRQLPPDEGPIVPLRGRKWPLRVATGLAAASIAGLLALGTHSMLLDQELTETRQALERSEHAYGELTEVLTAPDADAVHHDAEDAAVTVIVSESRGKLAVIPHGMSEPPGDDIYQVWFIEGDTPTSAGLLAEPDRPLVTDADHPADVLGITVEPAGGSDAPTSEPIMVVAYPG